MYTSFFLEKLMRSGILAIILLVSILGSTIALADRLLVPEYVSCDRDQLTSWTGQVVAYNHHDIKTQITLDTDDGTTESLTLELSQADTLMAQYYVHGKHFTPSDWVKIEDEDLHILPNIRATVWLCHDTSILPIINWLPPR
jgi:hypothetical protein